MPITKFLEKNAEIFKDDISLVEINPEIQEKNIVTLGEGRTPLIKSIHLAKKLGPVPCLLFAYVVTGWISTCRSSSAPEITKNRIFSGVVQRSTRFISSSEVSQMLQKTVPVIMHTSSREKPQ